MRIKAICILFVLSCCFTSLLSLAEENKITQKVSTSTDAEMTKDSQLNNEKNTPVQESSSSTTPQVGKHVMANMDAGSMILSLFMVLALIVVCAFVLKRFNLTQQGVSQLKVITSLSLGAKERIMVVQVGDQQLLLGVTSQQVTLIERLAEPLAEQKANAVELPMSVLSFLSTKKSMS